MSVIRFKKEFYKPIKEGRKTQTIRTPEDRLDVRRFDFATCVFKDCPEKIYVTVTDVGYVKLKDLSLDMARREGFDSVAELKNVLYSIYPDISRWDKLYYYRFRVEGVTETVKE